LSANFAFAKKHIGSRKSRKSSAALPLSADDHDSERDSSVSGGDAVAWGLNSEEERAIADGAIRFKELRKDVQYMEVSTER